jgi:ClpP class serine protease
MTESNRHALRTGEYLAIKPDAVQRDEFGLFISLGPPPAENERRGTVAIVCVRGALSHYASPCGDSYEAIVCRVKAALECDPPPTAVLFRIESPGGVVAGLNEAVFKLQKMSKAAKVPFIAYVDELAASAAYALCCACSEVIAPPSAVIGSVGTISTMVSAAEADKKMGLDFRLITSGKHKADGHVHAPITDDAVKAESGRNAEMAAQFFALAGKARGMPPAKLASLEAAIYLAKDAKRAGLIDDVMCLDDVIMGLDASEVSDASGVAPNEGNVTDRRARNGTPLDKRGAKKPDLSHTGTEEAHMAVKLDALIKKTEAAISTETDPRKLSHLRAQLAAFTATKAEMDDDDGDDDKGGDDDDDEEQSKAKKAAEEARKAKGKAEAAKHRAKAAEHKQKAAEYEEAAKKAEESEEESEEKGADERRGEEEARLSAGAAAALAGQGDIALEALREVHDLKAKMAKRDAASAERERLALITEAAAQRRITPNEAKTLKKKDAAFVRDFLDMRPNAIVMTEENALVIPNGSPHADVSPAAMKEIERALSVMPKGTDLVALKAQMIEDHRKSAMNGAGERY